MCVCPRSPTHASLCPPRARVVPPSEAPCSLARASLYPPRARAVLPSEAPCSPAHAWCGRGLATGWLRSAGCGINLGAHAMQPRLCVAQGVGGSVAGVWGGCVCRRTHAPVTSVSQALPGRLPRRGACTRVRVVCTARAWSRVCVVGHEPTTATSANLLPLTGLCACSRVSQSAEGPARRQEVVFGRSKLVCLL